jgi:hypothetical protein
LLVLTYWGCALMKKESNICWDTWFNCERVSDDFMMDREQGVLLPMDFKALEGVLAPDDREHRSTTSNDRSGES